MEGMGSRGGDAKIGGGECLGGDWGWVVEGRWDVEEELRR